MVSEALADCVRRIRATQQAAQPFRLLSRSLFLILCHMPSSYQMKHHEHCYTVYCEHNELMLHLLVSERRSTLKTALWPPQVLCSTRNSKYITSRGA